ncbi:hypothetical protein MUP01_12140 [Candidatus Bathyarchaeota archaeon]|nr:hypothetical protein [Candidatus Bathyarchaeota archaeon]
MSILLYSVSAIALEFVVFLYYAVPHLRSKEKLSRKVTYGFLLTYCITWSFPVMNFFLMDTTDLKTMTYVGLFGVVPLLYCYVVTMRELLK